MAKDKKYGGPAPSVAERKARIEMIKARRKEARLKRDTEKRDKAKTSGNVGKQKRAQNKINKASGSDKKHTKKTIKAANAKDKSWKAATASAAKSGTSISSLVKQRSGLTKGTAEYAKVQNQINKHYGSTKVHKAPEKKVAKPVEKKVSKAPRAVPVPKKKTEYKMDKPSSDVRDDMSGRKKADEKGGENSYNKEKHNGSFTFNTAFIRNGYKAGE